jgi:cell division protein ftsA
VRIGSPLNITGLTDYVNRPQYSTVVGLLQYHHQNSDNDPVDNNYGDEALGKKFWKGLKNIFNKVKSEF